MMKFAFFTLAVFYSLPLSAMAVSLGQIDNFQDGTGDGWLNGAQATDPINIADGGPLGVGDHYLQITADGSGPAGRLTSYNRSQWIGNYISANVNGISMDLKSFDASPSTILHIRLALKATTLNGAPSYVTPDFLLPTDGAWHHAEFLLNSSLIPLNSPSALSTFLVNPAELRIIESVSASSNGDNIVSQLGVDNIHATPEPSTIVLLGIGAIGLLAYAWRRRRQAS